MAETITILEPDARYQADVLASALSQTAANIHGPGPAQSPVAQGAGTAAGAMVDSPKAKGAQLMGRMGIGRRHIASLRRRASAKYLAEDTEERNDMAMSAAEERAEAAYRRRFSRRVQGLRKASQRQALSDGKDLVAQVLSEEKESLRLGKQFESQIDAEDKLERMVGQATDIRTRQRFNVAARDKRNKEKAFKDRVNQARGVSIPLFSAAGRALGGQFGGMLGMGFGFQGGAEMLARMPISPSAMLKIAGGAAVLGTAAKAVHGMMGSETRSRLAQVSGQMAAAEARSELRAVSRDRRSARRTSGLLDHQSQVEEEMADAMADIKDTVVTVLGPTIIVMSKAIAKTLEFVASIGRKIAGVTEDDMSKTAWDMTIEMMAMEFANDGNPAFRELHELMMMRRVGMAREAAAKELAAKKARADMLGNLRKQANPLDFNAGRMF